MKIKLVNKSFEGHQGRPGMVGGSLPRGMYMSPQKDAGGGGKSKRVSTGGTQTIGVVTSYASSSEGGYIKTYETFKITLPKGVYLKDYDDYTLIDISPEVLSSSITVYKNRRPKFGGIVEKAQINWSAWGSQKVENTELFHAALGSAIEIAKKVDSFKPIK